MISNPLVQGEVVYITKGCATPDEPFEVCVLRVEADYGETLYYVAWYDLEPEGDLVQGPEATVIVGEPCTSRRAAERAARTLAVQDRREREAAHVASEGAPVGGEAERGEVD